MELRDAYAKPTGKNLCDANKAILAECHVCSALGSPLGGDACCVSVDAFAQCHIRVTELFDEIEELETNVIKPQLEEIEAADTEMPSKRYGNLMTNWFGDKDKRYGNLMGNTFGKRYGNLMGHSLGKRYGNLYGGLFGSNRWKKYGYTFGNLFNKKTNKQRND